jgi:hypothetical protein
MAESTRTSFRIDTAELSRFGDLARNLGVPRNRLLRALVWGAGTDKIDLDRLLRAWRRSQERR